MVSYPYVWTPVILVLGVGLLLSSVYLALIVFAIVMLAAFAATLAAPYLLVRAVARRLRERRAARRDWRPALSDDASAPRGTARRV
jgi:cytochrome c biogenesis protein CcdA